MARNPLPKALNDLKGDPSNRRRNTVEPTSPAGAPAMPSYLDGIAKAEWRSVVQHLDSMNLLSKCDSTALELYVNCYSRYRKAQAHVMKEGAIILSSKGYEQKSGWATEADKQHVLLTKSLAMFGLSPADRAKMRIKQETPTANKWKIVESA